MTSIDVIVTIQSASKAIANSPGNNRIPLTMPAQTEHLPHVDEHSTVIEADPGVTWDALLRVADRSSASTRRISRLLGCADVVASGPRPLASGSTLPGFHVETAERPRELALVGRHRYSDYALIFRLDENQRGTYLRAETRAAFPGLKGRAYRALVIGTRGHVLATRRLLAGIKHQAERTPS